MTETNKKISVTSVHTLSITGPRSGNIALLRGPLPFPAIVNANITMLASHTNLWYMERMGYGEDIIADFKANPSEKLLCIFEYVRPCYPEDEYNIVFLAKDGDEVKLYHYLNEADTPEENAKLDAVLKYFRQKGIKLKIRLLQTGEKPFHSAVLYPAEDSGKPFYVSKTPTSLWKRLYQWCTFTDEFQLNKDLAITQEIRTVTVKRWQDRPVLLYGHPEGAELRDDQWELDPNW